MYLLTVIPVKKGLPLEELSYYTKHEVTLGDLVSVPFRKDKIVAVITSITPLSEAKQSIKEATYGLRRIYGVIKKESIPREFSLILEEIASIWMRPISTLIASLLDQDALLHLPKFYSHTLTHDKSNIVYLEDCEDERYARYQAYIREHLARQESVACVVPTVTDAIALYDMLRVGIKDMCVLYHGSLTEKQKERALTRILIESECCVIITTPTLIPWARPDLRRVIIEREHSQYYYQYGDMSISLKHVLMWLARATHVDLIVGSRTLSVDTWYESFTTKHKITSRASWDADPHIHLVDMNDKMQVMNPHVSMYTWRILDQIARNKQGHYFLYTQRKGMYPTSICTDCGKIVACATCTRPYVLHNFAGVRSYVCHHCESTITLPVDTPYTCAHCNSWKFTSLGIGTSGLVDMMTRLELPTFLIDGDHTPTRSKQHAAYQEFKKSPYGVLIGTEMAANLVHGVDGITMISFDGLFSLPEYRTDEKIYALINELKDRVSESGTIIVQTRIPTAPIFGFIDKKQNDQFMRHELAIRNMAELPPYYVLIKGSFTMLKEQRRIQINELIRDLSHEWFEAGKGITLLFIHIEAQSYFDQPEIRIRIRNLLHDAHISVLPLTLFSH